MTQQEQAEKNAQDSLERVKASIKAEARLEALRTAKMSRVLEPTGDTRSIVYTEMLEVADTIYEWLIKE